MIKHQSQIDLLIYNHRLYQGVRRCHLHIPAVDYCMSATFTCLCMPVNFAMHVHVDNLQERTHLQANNSKTAYIIMARWRPHPVNGEFSIIIYPSSLGRVGHCGTSIHTSLPYVCLVVGSNEVHDETIYAWW